VTALLLFVLAQSSCTMAEAEASTRVGRFDLAGASAVLRTAVEQGCADLRIAALYLDGLVEAREAFRQGAPPESLTSVRAAATALEQLAANQPGQAAIAHLLLRAAAAGAQSERAEMALYLDTAARMESLQRAARQPGAPFVSSLELAGDLWLQLFDYARAREAYAAAIEQNSRTARATAGLARAAARLGMEDLACREYGELLSRWNAAEKPAEILEAETYLERACRGAR
jgi:hypothetical protein